MSRRFVVVAIAACCCLIGGSAKGEETAPAPKGDPADLLAASLPEGMVFTVGCSSGAALFESMDATLEDPLVRAVLPPEYQKWADSRYAWLSEQAKLEQAAPGYKRFLEVLGIDENRPMVAGLRGSDKTAIAVIPVADLDVFLEETGLVRHEEPEFQISGAPVPSGSLDKPGGSEVYWLYHEGYAFACLDGDFRESLAASLAHNAEALRGASAEQGAGQPHAFVHLTKGAFSPELFAGIPDEVVDLIPFQMLKLELPLLGRFVASLRIEAIKTDEARDFQPQPLALPRLLPDKPVYGVAVRLTGDFMNWFKKILALTVPKEEINQATGFVEVLNSVLGEELLLANLSNDTMAPRFVALAETPNPAMLRNFLGMAGVMFEPWGSHGDVQVEMLHSPLPFPVYFASLGKHVVAAYHDGDIVKILDNGAEGTNEHPIAMAKFQAATHGFLYINAGELFESEGLPASVTRMFVQANPRLAGIVDSDLLAEVYKGEQGFSLQEHADRFELAFHGKAAFTTQAAILIPAVARAMEAANKAAGQNSLKQLGLITKMYGIEHAGHMPPLSPVPGVLTMDPERVYPEYLDDPSLFVSPGHDAPPSLQEGARENPAKLMNDYHYIYLPHLVRNQAELENFAEAYKQAAADGGKLDAQFELDGKPLPTARDLSAADGDAAESARAAAVVFVERPGLRIPKGGNVLYLDGRAEMVEFGRFPQTDAFWKTIAALDQLEAGGPMPAETPYGHGAAAAAVETSTETASTPTE